MYAIIKSGSKQYRVKKGDKIDVELLPAQVGDAVEFNEVLFFNDNSSIEVGKPLVSGCIVKGKVVDQVKGPKIQSVKYIPRKHSRRKFGHRQHYMRVEITEIATGA